MDNKARNRRQAARDGSAHGKAVRKVWEQSEAGKVSQRLRNQRRRDKQQAAKAAEQATEIRDKDDKLIGHIVDGVVIPLPIEK